MAKQHPWLNAKGKMQWKEWVLKKERGLCWWESGRLAGATNCSGEVRTYVRPVGSRGRSLLSVRELVLTPMAGGRAGNRVDLRCTVPTWGRTVWRRVVAWYCSPRPVGLTKKAFCKKRDGEPALYEWEVHRKGFNHKVSRWEKLEIVRHEENLDEYRANWHRYLPLSSKKRPAAAASRKRPAAAISSA